MYATSHVSNLFYPTGYSTALSTLSALAVLLAFTLWWQFVSCCNAVQQETLEREIARLRLLFQQQQQHQQSPQPALTHSRSNSRDLESQFNNLSLKHKEANSGRDPVTGPLRIWVSTSLFSAHVGHFNIVLLPSAPISMCGFTDIDWRSDLDS